MTQTGLYLWLSSVFRLSVDFRYGVGESSIFFILPNTITVAAFLQVVLGGRQWHRQNVTDGRVVCFEYKNRHTAESPFVAW